MCVDTHWSDVVWRLVPADVTHSRYITLLIYVWCILVDYYFHCLSTFISSSSNNGITSYNAAMLNET